MRAIFSVKYFIGIMLFILLTGVGWYAFWTNNHRVSFFAGATTTNPTEDFAATSIPLGDLADGSSATLDANQQLVINGTLQLNGGLVMAPTDAAPTDAVDGQFYYSSVDKRVYYFNGSTFNSLATTASLPAFLANIARVGAGIGTEGGELVNTGVLSVQGESGDVSLRGGQGISINGVNIANSGVLSLGNLKGDVRLDSSLSTAGSTLGLSATGVVAGTYGSNTEIAQISVDEQGRISSVVSTPIAGINFVAGSNLSGGGTVAPGETLTLNVVEDPVFESVEVTGTLNAEQIGIGVTNPAYALDVNGDINISAGSVYRIDGVAVCMNTGCLPTGGSNEYVQIQAASPGAVQTGNMNISGTAIAGSFSGSGLNLTNLNASQIASGTLSDLRLSANVTQQGNSFNGVSQLIQTTALGYFPALNGSLITNLNASQIVSGTLSDLRLSSNVALRSADQTFSGNNIFSSPITITGLQASNNGYMVAIDFTGTASGNVVYSFDASAAPGNYTICTSAGNCSSSSGGGGTGGGGGGGVSSCGNTVCPPADGSNMYIRNGVNSQVGANFNIQSYANSAVAGIIQGAAGQIADLLQLKNSSGATMASVSADGNLKQSSAGPKYLAGANWDGSINSGTGNNNQNGSYVYGRYLYVVQDGSSGTCSSTAGSAGGCELKIFDISNPSSPTYVSGADSSGTANGGTGSIAFNSVFVSGRYAYIAQSASSSTCSATPGSALGCELKIFDISNPSSPTYVSGADSSGTANGGTGSIAFNSVFVSGRYAYIAGAGSNATCSAAAGSANGCSLQIYDVANPYSPSYKGGIISTANTPNSGSGTGTGLKALSVSGSFAYAGIDAGNSTACAASPSSTVGCELRVYNISNPASPQLSATRDISGSQSGTDSGVITSISVNGLYAYVTSAGSSATCSNSIATGCEFKIFDVSSPSTPLYAGGADASGTTNGGVVSESDNDVAISGRYAYIAKSSGGAAACSPTGGSASGCEIQTFDVTGAQFTSANISSLESGSLQISESATVSNQLSVSGGLTVGMGGIQAAGSIGLNIADTSASQEALKVTNAGTGNIALLVSTNTSANGVSIKIGSSSSSQYALSVTSNNGSTTVLYARADGSVGIGTLSPSEKLHVVGNLKIQGHVVTANTSGSTTVAAGASACTSPTVSVSGNDSAGEISITTGTGCGSTGNLAVVTFANAFSSAPKVLITPTNSVAAGLRYYLGASAVGSFTLSTDTAPANSTLYKYNYLVIQ